MPNPDLAAIEARAAAATDELSRICLTPRDGFRMSIPANPTRDSDLILAAGLRNVPALIARIRELEAENAKIDDLDEALRQRDREILGLRRERDAGDARGVMQDARLASLLELLSRVTGGFPQTYITGIANPAEDDNPDLKPYIDATKAALADLRDRYL